MKKKRKGGDSIHDKFVKDIFSEKRRRKALLRLALPDKIYRLFNWKTLATEATTFVDGRGREIRTDIVLSAEIKRTEKKARIIFLIENKAQKNIVKTLRQFLRYQSTIYQEKNTPILPIAIYHGKAKTYRGPLRFRGFIEDYPDEVVDALGEFILSFGVILLNIHDVAIGLDPKTRSLGPILFVMKHIFNLNETIVAELFTLGEHLY